VKKVFMVFMFISAFILPLGAQDYGGNADFDSDFQSATKMAPSGTEAAKGTDVLVRDTTNILHREHMAILDEIAKLHKEIADLKKDVKTIKGQVE